MAESLMSYKPKSFGYGDYESANPSLEYLTGVLEGLTIAQEAATENDIMGEFSDFPLDSIGTLGKYTIEFDLGKYDPSEIQALEGGTYNATTGMYELPITFQNIYKFCRLEFYQGIEYLQIYKGKIMTNWDGADLKTAPLKLHVKITALVYNNKVVAKKFRAVDVSLNTFGASQVTAAGAIVTYEVFLGSAVTLTEKGVCYATHTVPYTSDAKEVSVGTAAGISSATLDTLDAATQYFARPYAISGGVTTYGDEISFTTAVS